MDGHGRPAWRGLLGGEDWNRTGVDGFATSATGASRLIYGASGALMRRLATPKVAVKARTAIHDSKLLLDSMDGEDYADGDAGEGHHDRDDEREEGDDNREVVLVQNEAPFLTNCLERLTH